MDKEKKLLKLLRDNNLGGLYAKLKDDLTFDDFTKQYQDQLISIPGYLDIFKDNIKDAPHGLNEEQQLNYFSDEDGNVDTNSLNAYKVNEEKYNTKLNAKTDIAEDYARAKEYDDMATFGGFNLGNEIAKKSYVKNKDKDPGEARGEALGNEVVGKAAGVVDFLPWPISMAGPAARTTQKILYADKPSDVFNAETGLDIATGAIPFGKAGYAGYQAVKRGLGKLGNWVSKTEPAKKLEQAFKHIDEAKELEKEAKNYADAYETIRKQNNKFAFDKEKNLKAPRTDDDVAELIEKAPELKDDLVKNQIDRQNHRVLFNYNVSDASLENKAKNLANEKGAIINSLGELDDNKFRTMPFNQKLKIADRFLAERNLNPNAVKAAETLEVLGRGTLRKYPRSKANNSEQNEREMESKTNKAIDWMIKENKSKWQSGIKPNPNGNILENMAYQKWLQGDED